MSKTSLSQQEFTNLIHAYPDKQSFHRFKDSMDDKDRYFIVNANRREQHIALEHTLQKIANRWYWIKNTPADEVKFGGQSIIKVIASFTPGKEPNFENSGLVKKEIRPYNYHIEHLINKELLPPIDIDRIENPIEEREKDIKREASINAALKDLCLWSKRTNKNNVEVHDMVLKHVRGENLEEYVTNKRDFYQISTISVSIIDQLKTMHNKGIIHGDISTKNIMVTFDKNKPGVELIDFGLSAKKSNKQKPTGVGTVRFAPPEVMNDSGAVSTKADYYNLGNVLYYLFTGKTWNEIAQLNKEKENFDDALSYDAFICAVAFKYFDGNVSNLDLKIKQEIETLHRFIVYDLFNTPDNRKLNQVHKQLKELSKMNPETNQNDTSLFHKFTF